MQLGSNTRRQSRKHKRLPSTLVSSMAFRVSKESWPEFPVQHCDRRMRTRYRPVRWRIQKLGPWLSKPYFHIERLVEPLCVLMLSMRLSSSCRVHVMIALSRTLPWKNRMLNDENFTDSVWSTTKALDQLQKIRRNYLIFTSTWATRLIPSVSKVKQKASFQHQKIIQQTSKVHDYQIS